MNQELDNEALEVAVAVALNSRFTNSRKMAQLIIQAYLTHLKKVDKHDPQ